ncbi:MAG: HNH endonuclease [Microcoleus sp. SIO2G3]|nr:HNH endonuclease [Microcoleus sp. SIO2G3]
MTKCYICEQEIIPGNTYDEHIVLNSLGGKLHSKGLICRKCSSQFDVIDSYLSKQLNPLANMLNIQRDRGNPQPIQAEMVKTGKKISLAPGGQPVLVEPTIETTEDGIHISARDRKQLRQVLQGLKRKYPKLDVEDILDKAIKKGDYVDSRVGFSIPIGGSEAFRAVCKMAMNFYIFRGGNRDYIAHLIPYIRSGGKYDYAWHFYPEDENLPDNLKDGKIIHSLFIKGNPKEKVLYSFIEFFSTFRFLVLLCDEYTGKEFQSTYSFDLLERVEIERNLHLDISKDEISSILGERVIPVEHLREKLDNIYKFTKQKQDYEHMNLLATESVDNCLGGLPEGTIFTEKLMRELIENFLEKMARFMHHSFYREEKESQHGFNSYEDEPENTDE